MMSVSIFAHRGLLHEYPENSMPALIEAVAHGYDIETDLRLTKDQDFVIIHDDTFERLAGKDIQVTNLTRKEIESLTYANSHEHFLALETLLTKLKTLNKKPLLALHLKSDSQNEIAYEKLSYYWKKFELYKHAFVFDLTTQAAHDLKKIDPEIKIAFIISETKFEPTIHTWDEVKENPDFDICWAAEYRSMYSKSLIDEMKAKKDHVYTMSPDVHTTLGHPLAYKGYEDTWKNLITWGSEGICTDEPHKLKSLLYNE